MNILWDFDGTLFDTYPVYTDIFKKVLGETVPKEEIYQHLKVSFSHAVEFFQMTEEQMERIDHLKREISPKDMLPYPYVEDVLKLAGTNVIMTHKSRRGVDEILTHYGWNHYFEEIVTIDNGFPRKPHPASYEYLHNKYKLDLIIGDRVLDILPGKQLGIRTCLFQNNQPGADFYLSDYQDFSRFIQI